MGAAIDAFDQDAVHAAAHVLNLVHEPYSELVMKLAGIFFDTAAAFFDFRASALVGNYNICPTYAATIHGIGECNHMRCVGADDPQAQAARDGHILKISGLVKR